MFELREFKQVQSLEEADQILQMDKKNVILGGLLWMRMGARQFHTGIDLSALGLDRIEDRGDRIDIGAMVTLRQLETSDLLADHVGPVLYEAVRSIVGVQFRNLATVGGSVFSRFAFSDVATALMVLDAEVHLFRAGSVPLADFLESSPGRDILVRLSIPKKNRATAYQSLRKSATDFPVLAAAFSRSADGWQIAMGARPSRAKLAGQTAAQLPQIPDKHQIQAACDMITQELSFGSNSRGSKAYREHLAPVLIKRGVSAICG